MTAHKTNVGQPWIKGLVYLWIKPWVCDSMILLFRFARVFPLSYPSVFSSSKSLAISFISGFLAFSAFLLNEGAELKARAKPTRDNRIKVFITSPNPNFWFKENRIELLYSLGRPFKCVNIVKIICWVILTKKKKKCSTRTFPNSTSVNLLKIIQYRTYLKIMLGIAQNVSK